MKVVIKFMGKQYLVSEESEIIAEKVNMKNGSKIKVDNILLFIDNKSVKIGEPRVKNAKVELEVLATAKSKKIKVIKFKDKKRYKRIKGHRQILSKLRVKKIEVK